MVENHSGGNHRAITTMLPISITPNPAPISARPATSTGQLGARVKTAPPIVASTNMPNTVNRGP